MCEVQLTKALELVLYLEMFLPNRFSATAGNIQVRDVSKSKAVVKRRMLVLRTQDEMKGVNDTTRKSPLELIEQYFTSTKARLKRKTTSKVNEKVQVPEATAKMKSTLEIHEISEQ